VNWRDDRGSELLEFAVASVVFFTILFGTIEFGLGVWQYNMTSDLAQEGARWAAVHGSSSASPATAAQLQTYVQGRSPGFSVTVTATPTNPSAAGPGTVIAVQVDSSFSPVTNLIPATTLNLTSTAKMRVFR
jgi:Flp pilus assembly protein TadG